jgi:glyceraldehyde 3-phosphate dehydrogenase/glyceraldehyde-3-phosphate dehydrogenase (NAD(P))
MSVTLGINGLGRIGRMILRPYLEHAPADVEIAAANDLASVDDLAYLIRYDSVQGKAPFSVETTRDGLRLGGKAIKVFNEKDPAKLPWGDLGVDVVLECTGVFRKREDAARHLEAGAKRVLISAPAKSGDLTVVLGVNEDRFDPAEHFVLSNASCTTNSLAPVVKVLNDVFGLDFLFATTVHAYTASQALVDAPARKRRRGRAAAVSLVPTSTGAAKATELVIPELEGRMDAVAVRTPNPDGALTDVVAHVNRETTAEEVNAKLKEAAEGHLKGILEFAEDEMVSADIIGNPHSAIIDAVSTKVIRDRAVKVLAWYDNEYGYANRMLDMAAYLASRI